jgi:hypothetical protein
VKLSLYPQTQNAGYVLEEGRARACRGGARAGRGEGEGGWGEGGADEGDGGGGWWSGCVIKDKM